MKKRVQFGNRFLDYLPPAEAELVIACSTRVSLPAGMRLFEQDVPVKFLYLLTSGMASVSHGSLHGDSLELSLLGTEGPIGWLLLLGPLVPYGSCVMRVAGEGLRVPLASMQELTLRNEVIRLRTLEFSQLKTMTAFQDLVCLNEHRIEQRLAKLLLSIGDCSQIDTFSITQETMARMLGVHRPSLSIELAKLHKAGIVRRFRGGIQVLNREALRETSCDCYNGSRKLHDNLYSHAVL